MTENTSPRRTGITAKRNEAQEICRLRAEFEARGGKVHVLPDLPPASPRAPASVPPAYELAQ